MRWFTSSAVSNTLVKKASGVHLLTFLEHSQTRASGVVQELHNKVTLGREAVYKECAHKTTLVCIFGGESKYFTLSS